MLRSAFLLYDDLKSLWPEAFIVLVDRLYELPWWKDVEILLVDSFINKYTYATEVFDCDDYALVLHAFIVQERYRKMSEGKPKNRPWAFGQALVSQLDGKEAHHAINICWTADKGLLLVEPQTDWARVADPERDMLHFIRM